MSIEKVLRSALTEHQYNAAVDPAREVWCLACAGSGKSRTLAYRITKLIADGARPESIVAFTFTEKAAEAIKQRVAEALLAASFSPILVGAMYIGTIHSYCQSVLGQMDARYRQFEVLDENRLILYLISRYWKLDFRAIRAAHPSGKSGAPAGYFDSIKEVAHAWKTCHDELIEISEIIPFDESIGATLEKLNVMLDQDQYIDFSLMIRLVVDALRRNDNSARIAVDKVKHLMVDEYQDVNPAQEALIAALHPGLKTLFVVGDDDQSIYSWRGADVNNILTFGQRYPQHSPHTLPENFRSTPAIVFSADNFAAQELGAQRISKNPIAKERPGPRDFRRLWFSTRSEEADWVIKRIKSLIGKRYIEKDGTTRGLTPADFAILMRSTRQPEADGLPRHAPFTRQLDDAGIKFTLEAGGGVFERIHIQILRDSFNLLRDGSPSREDAQEFFNSRVLLAFAGADFAQFTQVMSSWGRLIHAPIDGARRRVFPQLLVHELLKAFGADHEQLPDDVMFDLGVFSRIIQDVESVFVSVDTADRFRSILNFLQNVAESGYDAGRDELVQRPDAVTVSTVHRMKGLEFPVVFVVDVEAQRFPKKRSSYSGWLPSVLLRDALTRGAYQSTPAEEARLFYTAITRAEKFLYITGSENLPSARGSRKQSSFALRLKHPELLDVDGMPDGLEQDVPRRRVDENIVPTSYSEIRTYLRCPRDYRMRKVFGFSPHIPEMFGFGKTVHTAIAKLHEIYCEKVPSEDQAEQVAKQVFHLKHIPPSNDPENRPGGYERAMDSACRMTRAYVANHREDFSRERQLEVRFEIPVKHAVISGAIDLLLRMDKENKILDATVIDFKAVEGGNDPASNPELEWTDMSLQVQLYAKAANEVLGENARTGAVHLLKDNLRVDVPVDDAAVSVAIKNIEWAVSRILENDFPMRPFKDKCDACDFKSLCPKVPQQFSSGDVPPPIHVPGEPGTRMIRAFSEFTDAV